MGGRGRERGRERGGRDRDREGGERKGEREMGETEIEMKVRGSGRGEIQI